MNGKKSRELKEGEIIGNFTIVEDFNGKTADCVEMRCGCGELVEKPYSQLMIYPNTGCLKCRKGNKK